MALIKMATTSRALALAVVAMVCTSAAAGGFSQQNLQQVPSDPSSVDCTLCKLVVEVRPPPPPPSLTLTLAHTHVCSTILRPPPPAISPTRPPLSLPR
jgi:hypothetical protein